MILIIEDDQFKFDKIKSLLEAGGITAYRWCQSVHSGVQALSSSDYDLIVLDMALPSHDMTDRGGSPTSLPSGGLEIIYELSYAKREIPLIILTQYPEIEIEGAYVQIAEVPRVLRELYSTSIKSVIQFKQNDTSWVARFEEDLKG